MSLADPIFYPIAAILVMAFTLLTGAFLPQASGEIGNRADIQNGRLEIMSIISQDLHGVRFISGTEGPNVSADKAISYGICGAEEPDVTPVNSRAYTYDGSVHIPDSVDEDINYINGNPGDCVEDEDDNKWDFRFDSAAGDIARRDSYSTLLPVRGGGIAEVEVEYGVR